MSAACDAAPPRPLTATEAARVDALLDKLLDLPEAARAAALDRLACDDDALVRHEVASLLDAARCAGDFLCQPASPSAVCAAGQNDRTAPAIGARIGAWRVVRTIGSGGMGEVYEAERVEGGFCQRAALKLLRPEASGQLARFHAERQILASLDHPGIARLLDGGVADDGRPFMAMSYVEGCHVTTHCAQTGASLETRLALFRQVCEAVAYAHRHLVVHRDLKPANILVGPDDEVRLLDFGIAKLLDDADAGGTQTRTLAGPLTPLYAAPEQLTGGTITTATDVYALGLLLFELLTGEPPWAAGATPMTHVVRALKAPDAPRPSDRAVALDHPPVPPRLITGDLDAIVACALRAEPARRYSSVDALLRDLDHHRDGEPVAARDGARLYAIGRLLRRHRWAAASTAAVMLALSIGLGGAVFQAHRAAEQRDIAQRDAAREEALRYQITGLFRRAIADHGSATPTAKTMLDKSAERVLAEYRGQPRLAGQVVLTLADLYDALEDVQGSAALLEGFLRQAGADADPFAVADARQKLAGIELMRGHVDRSGRLLDQAEAYWAGAGAAHTEERLEGLGVRARWQRARGDLDGAVATQRAALAERVAHDGRDTRETAVLTNSLAITLAAANRLEEAVAAYGKTTAIYARIGLGDGLDAQIVRGNTGTLQLRLGHLHDAETLLRGAVDHERALAGDSAAVAASLGYLGKVLSITNQPTAALPALHEAAAMAARYAGATSPVALQNRLFLGEAELAAGNVAAARAGLEGVLADATAGDRSTRAIALRSGIALAEGEAAAGQRDAARQRLASVVDALRGLGTSSTPVLAQALVAIGSIALTQRDKQAALAALGEAVRLREAAGSSDWELALARERLGEAMLDNGDPVDGRPLVVDAESTLRAQLGTAHPETQRARRALTRSVGG